MAKIVEGSLVLHPDDVIEFVDHYDIKHKIFWDEDLDRFVVEGNLSADGFIGATNAVTADRNPQPSDDSYIVPSIWINSTTNVAHLLVNNNAGNAIWSRISFTIGADLEHRIVINDGDAPATTDPFDMWVIIEP